MTSVQDIVAMIRSSAQHIPLGGVKRIKGGDPISAYNLAEHIARTIEDAAAGKGIYQRLCDEPATKAQGQATLEHDGPERGEKVQP